MTRFVSVFMAFCLSVCVFSGNCAAAVNSNELAAADALYNLGLFKGTANGYELERKPTRAEALTMLIRFLGVENDALYSKYSCPFTDASGWYGPYISYAWEKGLTKGVGNNLFAPDRDTTFNEYAVMLLRALGYTVDYNGALAKAQEIGIFDYVSPVQQVFTRGDMVLMSYGALFVNSAESGDNLLQTLLSAGVITSNNLKATDFASVKQVSDALQQKNVSPIKFFTAGGKELTMDMTEGQLELALGKAGRVDPSPYGFSWYIYNSDYNNFVMVGMLDGKSCAFYSNAAGTSCGGAVVGKSLDGPAEEFSNAVLTIFLDGVDEDIGGLLAAPRILTVSEKPSADVMAAMELQLMDITNAERASGGLAKLSWSSAASSCAEGHSADMSERNYFSHTSLDGRTSMDRLTEHGVFFTSCAENIAQGYRSVFAVHHAWMNSEGHRAAIMEKSFKYFGAGITDDYYYTECFFAS